MHNGRVRLGKGLVGVVGEEPLFQGESLVIVSLVIAFLSFVFQNMMLQHLNLRCVFAIGPRTLGYRVPTIPAKTRLKSSIIRFNHI